MMQNNKKIVIIEAGIAGLCAAVYARKCGYDVDVFEQHGSAGGLGYQLAARYVWRNVQFARSYLYPKSPNYRSRKFLPPDYCDQIEECVR
jgi:phytoene dehydrogenase-like protein